MLKVLYTFQCVYYLSIHSEVGYRPCIVGWDDDCEW
jgi:hypothetical protein